MGLLLWCLFTVGGGVGGCHASDTPGNDFALLIIMAGIVGGFIIGCGVFFLMISWKRPQKKIDKD